MNEVWAISFNYFFGLKTVDQKHKAKFSPEYFNFRGPKEGKSHNHRVVQRKGCLPAGLKGGGEVEGVGKDLLEDSQAVEEGRLEVDLGEEEGEDMGLDKGRELFCLFLNFHVHPVVMNPRKFFK